ncbi:MAG: pentapeptide repeat-containing protein [Deltaproteobacteria bacterium]|nr:pentapeptide repeat-containing protein [Deltaproteobacteria bacterium]
MKTGTIETKLAFNVVITAIIGLLHIALSSGCAMKGPIVADNMHTRLDGRLMCHDNILLDSGFSCEGARLAAANLTGRDISGVKFIQADLRFAVLNETAASGSDFSGANLSRSKLQGADLRGSNLENADLSFADLRGADLRGARLEGARLAGADLRGARIDGSVNTAGAIPPDAAVYAYETKSWGMQPEPDTRISL